VRRAGADGWAKVRDAAYDAVEFVHRHVLRSSTGGDPRERALHVVVRLLTGVTDAIRHRLLVERASQVFGLSEAVIARAARQASAGGTGAPEPVSIAIRAQREAAGRVDRDFLLGLWYAPAPARGRPRVGAPDHLTRARRASCTRTGSSTGSRCRSRNRQRPASPANSRPPGARR
jgi:hypothetical protein